MDDEQQYKWEEEQRDSGGEQVVLFRTQKGRLWARGSPWTPYFFPSKGWLSESAGTVTC